LSVHIQSMLHFCYIQYVSYSSSNMIKKIEMISTSSSELNKRVDKFKMYT
jgi:hypothetical protein